MKLVKSVVSGVARICQGGGGGGGVQSEGAGMGGGVPLWRYIHGTRDGIG